MEIPVYGMSQRAGSKCQRTTGEKRMVRFGTAIAAAVASLFCLWLIAAALSFAQEQVPHRRVSGLKAYLMEEKLKKDIAAAEHAGRDVTKAEKLKAEGDRAMSAGRMASAKEHYTEAEKALGGSK
jgi:hypothetical protein